MKFDLPQKEVNIVEGKWVRLPLNRFSALMEYVEGLEDKVVDLEINLRESERVGTEMEALPVQAGSNSVEDAKRVELVLQRDPGTLKKQMEEHKLSIRRLAMMTSIPYATLYRYLHRQCNPSFKTTEAIRVFSHNAWYDKLMEHQR